MKFFMTVFILFISLFVSVLVTAQTAIRPDITVNSVVEVRAGRPIYLKDIAAVGNVAADLERQAGETLVLEAMEDGQKISLKNINLLKTIRNKIGESAALGSLAWTYFVPEEVTIKATKNFLNPSSISFDIESELRRKCAECAVTIRDFRVPTIKESKTVKQIDVDYESLKIGGAFILPVNVVTEGGKRTYWITGYSKISKHGPIATRQISAGERISDKDFRMDLVDVTFARDGVPTATELQNQLAGRNISVNQPIFKGDIKRELAVKRGQAIKVITGTDLFEIVGQGIADDQGYVGDTIKLKTSETQKWITGQIIEPGVVRVQ